MSLSVIVPTLDLTHVPTIPPGAIELILQGGSGGAAHAKNLGARRARGDVLAFVDDDSQLDGDLSYLSDPPAREAWWVPKAYVDGTDDPYTVRHLTWQNAMLALRVHSASFGPFQAVRAALFHRVGGFSESAVLEDIDLDRKLRSAGYRYATAPVTVTVTRRLSTFDETFARHHERHANPEPFATAPYRVLRPAQVAPFGLGTKG